MVRQRHASLPSATNHPPSNTHLPILACCDIPHIAHCTGNPHIASIARLVPYSIPSGLDYTHHRIMAYVAVVKALYEYAAQDPETELSLKEDQVCYVIEKEDDEWVEDWLHSYGHPADGSWWKAKLKDENGQEGPIGLIPAAYVEEVSYGWTALSFYQTDASSYR